MHASSETALPGRPWPADAFARREEPALAAFRQNARQFALREIAPFAAAWDEAGTFPRELYLKAGAAGLLAAGFEPRYGGDGGDIRHVLIIKEELTRFGSGGVRAGLTSHTIALPPLLRLASAALCERIIPAVLKGERLMALAVSEPSGGSDVANLNTRADWVDGRFIVNGKKLFISTGMRADHYVLAARTDGPGKAAISLLLVDRSAPGFTRREQRKMGWWASDTAELTFENCPVPADCLIGERGQGFAGLMHNFNEERLGNSAIVLGASKACYDDAVTWATQRLVSGQPLIHKQVIRHKLIDMATRIQAGDALLAQLAQSHAQGDTSAASIAMLKNFTTETYESCASEAVQIHGGHGVLRENRVERLFREAKILSIGGGAVEVLKDLAARQLGFA